MPVLRLLCVVCAILLAGCGAAEDIQREAEQTFADLKQRPRSKDSSCPSPKILGCEIIVAAHRLAQIFVDHARVDRLAIALIVDVLK